MKKLLVIAAGAAGAYYARQRREQQQAERDLHAAAAPKATPRAANPAGAAWAAASDQPG